MGVDFSFFRNQAYNVDRVVKDARNAFGRLRGGTEVLGKTVFKDTKTTGAAPGLSARFTKVGYVPDGKRLPSEFLVTITSFRARTTIVGIIQDPIMLGVESVWEPFIPTEVYGPADTLIQTLTASKWSLVTKATSRRKWKGSTPLEISLPLKFHAVDDPFLEVVEPCRILQSLALPSEGKDAQNLRNLSDAKKAIPFLAPPGPTPFTSEDLLNRSLSKINKTKEEKILRGLRGGDLIVVKFGRFLTLFNVILKSARVEFHPRFDVRGNPISATANLVFESYEILTSESLAASYTKGSLSSRE